MEGMTSFSDIGSYKFSVYSHQLVIFNDRLISRQFIVLKDSYGNIVRFTTLHRHIHSNNNKLSKPITDDGNNRFWFVCAFLNFVFIKNFSKYQITSLTDLTIDMVKDFFANYGTDSENGIVARTENCSKCKMEWWSSVKNRTSGEATCPYCDGRKAIPGETSLAALFFDISRELDSENNIDADTLLPGSSQYVKWNCSECKMNWQSAVRDRVSGEATCPYCDGCKAIPGKTSLAVSQSELMKEWKYISNFYLLDPDTINEKCNNEVWWKCPECNNSYKMSPKARLYNQKRKFESCPYCKGRRRRKRHFFLVI